jgi:hypothetical protein
VTAGTGGRAGGGSAGAGRESDGAVIVLRQAGQGPAFPHASTGTISVCWQCGQSNVMAGASVEAFTIGAGNFNNAYNYEYYKLSPPIRHRKKQILKSHLNSGPTVSNMAQSLHRSHKAREKF